MSDFRPVRSPLRVLVADGSRDEADALAILAGLWGYEPLVAYTGPAALAAALAGRPDVILLDPAVPGTDGCEVARQLRAAPEMQRVLLVAVASCEAEVDRPGCREAGFDHVLVKPFNPDDLRRLLDLAARLIQDSRQRAGAAANPEEAQAPGEERKGAAGSGEGVAGPLQPGS
jgi:DNA-binding response OmpR family regulator